MLLCRSPCPYGVARVAEGDGYMFSAYLREIKENLSGEACLDNMIDISRFHRVQSSVDFRRSAVFCRDRFVEWGLEAHVVDYEANGDATYWTTTPPLEWDATGAELWLEEPAEHRRCLASLRDTKVSLFERSGATIPGGVQAELVVLADFADLAETDVRGKFVLVNGAVDQRWQEIKERGAIGIVSDQMNEIPGVRHPTELPGARQRGRFRNAPPGDPGCVGFTVSPREGQKLRQLDRDLQKAGGDAEELIVRAQVNATFREGNIQNVSAFIPGVTDEEILVTAHLCHPAGMAADNASGVGTVMEIARTLKSLIDQGKLDRPKRGIRFLLVPEMTGTYAYLAQNEDRIPHMVAGINLDMVGQIQELCKGPLLLVTPPRATGCCSMELLERILLATGVGGRTPSGSAKFPLFKYQVTSFTGGSDHYILSDPSVGVATPMLIQWPDKFYHTTYDSIDKMDPAMLKRVGILGATYAYFMANAGAGEAAWLASQVAGGCRQRVSSYVQDGRSSLLQEIGKCPQSEWSLQTARDKCDFELERTREDLQAVLRLCEPADLDSLRAFVGDLQAELDDFVQREISLAAREAEVIVGQEEAVRRGLFADAAPEQIREARDLLPKRLYRGPVDRTFLYERLQALDHDRREAYRRLEERPDSGGPAATHLFTMIQYWIDGERSVYDVARSVALETGFFDLGFVVEYINLLADMGLVQLGD